MSLKRAKLKILKGVGNFNYWRDMDAGDRYTIVMMHAQKEKIAMWWPFLLWEEKPENFGDVYGTYSKKYCNFCVRIGNRLMVK